ncbi:MAG: protein kinase [Candidatus Riflebacteria bacterium]|nr:protein kinase [Candidatus Riflebacteria bacterium]
MKTGETIDRFVILKKLGHGGMGGVFIGFDQQSDELVAVKILFQEYADDEVYVRRFDREIAILKSLVHPNVVKLVDSGVDRELHFMALEYVRGRTLSDLVASRRRLPLEIGLKIVKDVARALAYAHSNGVVHRDIKPANIMVVEPAWQAKILDFGVAYVEDQLLQTSMGRFVGTLSYASPEQVQGKPADERADLYSMGLVCYEMLTGKKAIIGTNQAGILQQQLSDAFVPPSQIEPSLPSELNNIVLKLLRSDPQSRYQKADQFLYDLELFESRYKSMSFHSRSVYDFPEFVKEFQEANASFEAKDYDAALRITQDLAKKAPRAAEVFFLLGKVQTERGFVYNAIQEYIKATAFDPENTYYHLSLGIAYQAIGMRPQAKTELETALRLDPNSRIVRQRLEELGQLMQSTEPPPVTESGGPTPAPFLAKAEADKEASDRREQRRRAPIIARLKELRPPPKSRGETALRSVAWWGAGFSFIGARRKVMLPTIVQVAVVGLGLYLITHPQLIRSWAESATTLVTLAEFLKKQPNLVTAFLAVYALGTVYFINDAVTDAYLMGLQGHVIQEKSERQWVTLNFGKDRGARILQIFHVFKEDPPGSGRGRLVGRLLVKEVLDDTCSGPYYPDTRDPIAMGDVAIAQQALRSKLIEPEEPSVGRFPPSDTLTAAAENPGPTEAQAAT